jgi:hypothetical protein
MDKKRIQELEKSEKILKALEAAGVDNWEGYDIAMEPIQKEDELESLLYDKAEEILEVLCGMIEEPAARGAGYGFYHDADDEVVFILRNLIKEL